MFPSMSHESAKDPRFQELASAVQSAFHAKALEDHGTSSEDLGLSFDPDTFGTPEIKAKRAEWLRHMDSLSPVDQQTFSDFAHRQDYPRVQGVEQV